MGREGGSERAGNGGRLETAALCPGELNWMGTCWGSRCWAWDLDRDWDWDWGELIFVGGYLPGELAKSYLPVDRPTQVAHTLHATAHSKVCLMPELALDAPFHATPSVSSPRPLPVKAQELRLCHRGCPPHTAPSPSTPSMPPPLTLQVCPHSPLRSASSSPSFLTTWYCLSDLRSRPSHMPSQTERDQPIVPLSWTPQSRGRGRGWPGIPQAGSRGGNAAAITSRRERRHFLK